MTNRIFPYGFHHKKCYFMLAKMSITGRVCCKMSRNIFCYLLFFRPLPFFVSFFLSESVVLNVQLRRPKNCQEQKDCSPTPQFQPVCSCPSAEASVELVIQPIGRYEWEQSKESVKRMQPEQRATHYNSLLDSTIQTNSAFLISHPRGIGCWETL